MIPTNAGIISTSVGIILTHVGTIPTLGEIISTLCIMCRNLSYKILTQMYVTQKLLRFMKNLPHLKVLASYLVWNMLYI